MNNKYLDYKYQAEIKKSYKPVTVEDEAILVIKAKAGDDVARATLLNSQLNQIISIAKGFVTDESPLVDLIAEGTLGFYKGLEDFQIGRGVRLITYTMHWIKAYISKYVHDNDTIRHPNNVQDRINKIAKAKKALLHGDKIDAETKKLLDDSENEFPIKYNVRSINEPINKIDRLESTIEDTLGETDLKINFVQNMVGVKRVLALLNDRELEVFELFYGLNGNDSHTVEEIASIIGPRAKSGKITKQNISLIKNKAIMRLHAHFKIKESELEEV